MRIGARAARWAAGTLIAAGLGLAADERKAAYEDWYPADITPPAGTRYPCALTPLPRALPGIPEDDRRFVNHAYTLILRATQAKLIALRALEHGADLDAALAGYQAATKKAADGIRTEAVPAGLEPFEEDVLAALALQQTFFAKAVPLCTGKGSMREVYAIPEGREASRRLISAFGRMQARYPAWAQETRDSIYHHLCALDLF